MMSGSLSFAGRVALVTGAGNGLGRIYALQFAERGASVVVNDLGGDIKGGGASSRPADLVVEEIKAKGGKAVANYDSVEFGEKLVETAIKNFGRIDIVINNAGILRDKSFARMSDVDWQLVHKVHMWGAFSVTRAAWPHMRKQQYGKIIVISSPAGIYGNFGQANYSAAKLGLVGFSQTLAKEGAKYNITANAVAPTAGSRLLATVSSEAKIGLVGFSQTLAKEGAKYNISANAVAPTAGSRMLATVSSDEMMNALKPEYISPLVVYLCHEDTEETGGLFECAAGWIGKTRWQTTEGALVAHKDKQLNQVVMSPEDVKDKWAKITDFSKDPTYRQEDPMAGNTKTMDCVAALENGKPLACDTEMVWSYTERDVILYALGVGVSTTQTDHLKFLFELSDDFCALPTFPVLVAFNNASLDMSKEATGIDIDPAKILHGEQYIELYKPVSTSGAFRTQSEVVDVIDKGSGAVVINNLTVHDDEGDKVALIQMATFVVGAGGFGGKRSSDKAIASVKHPNRQADAHMQETTCIDQAALYRLSGDRNPLHLDPSFAAMGGFEQPILHGLCTLGFACRHVLAKYADNDVTRFKAMKVRFSKPVIPGQTIKTNMWKEGNRVFFESEVVETGNVAITGGFVDLHSDSTNSKL